MGEHQIIEYIKSALSQGKSKEDIYKELLNQGLSVEAIQSAFYQITAEEEQESFHKKIIYIIAILGAILLGIGFASLIAINWKNMSEIVKLTIVSSLMIIFYISGLIFKRKLNYKKTGEALLFLGGITYGIDIVLIASMVEISKNVLDVITIWMIGCIIMALTAESFSLFYFSILLGLFSIIGYQEYILSDFLLEDNSIWLISSIFLFLSAIVTFFAGWFIKKRLPVELKEVF